MRQSYISKVEECFELLKNEGKTDVKGTSYRSALAKEINYWFKKLEKEDYEKWTRLNIEALDPKYIADVIVRVEFIMLSLFRLYRKEGLRMTLNDYRYSLVSPLLPHNKKYTEESNLIESSLRLYFGKSWGHESVILRDFNHYFIAKQALSENFLHLDILPGVKIDKTFMSKELFVDGSPIFWGKVDAGDSLKTTRSQIYRRIILKEIYHRDGVVSPSEFIINEWFPEDNKKSVTVKFAVKDRDGEIYELKPIYNHVIKNKYKHFLKDIAENQKSLKIIRKKNEDIEIQIKDLIDFVSETLNVTEPYKNWLDRVKVINFYDVLKEEKTKVIKLKDVNHWIGLPNVGKTTIMNILAAYLSTKMGLKVALILRENSDVDASVVTLNKSGVNAIPFIGFSTQTDHLKRRLNTLNSVYDISDDVVVPYYSNECKLKSVLDLSARDDVSNKDFCYSLCYHKKDIYNDKNAKTEEEIKYKGKLSCPYIMECLKFKSRHEFDEAKVYLTNIQSFIKTVTKKTIFKEQTPSYELLLKECDVIFVDEADNMLDTIDSFFVDEEFIVEGAERGTLELILEEVERESHGKKANDKDVTKWLRAARHCKSTAEVILHMITDGIIPKTITKNPFTSRSVFNYLASRLVKPNLLDATEDSFENPMEGLEFEDSIINEKRVEMFNYYTAYIDNFVLGYSKDDSYASDDSLLNAMMQTSTTVFYTTYGDFPVKSEECFNAFLEKFGIVLENNSKSDLKKIEQLKNLFRFAMAVTTFEVLYNYTQVNIDYCRSFIKNDELINKTGFANPFYKHYEGILPLAAGGGKYGLSYEDEKGKKSLKIKKYLNIGRYLLYDMPRAFSSLDKTDTARVVFLSATSYMPFSPNYHIDVEPDYILENDDISNLKINYKKLFLYDSEGNIIKFSGCSPEFSGKILEEMAKDLCFFDNTNPESVPKITKIYNTTMDNRKRVAFTVGSFDEAIKFGHALKRHLSESGLISEYKLCIIDSSESRQGHEGLDVFVKGNLDKFNITDYNIAIIVTKSLERGVNILTQAEYNKYVAAFSTLVYIKRPYLIPNNLNDLVAILNSYSLDMYRKTYEEACEYLGSEYSIRDFMIKVNREVSGLESAYYNRTYYKFIKDEVVRMSILANILVSTHQLEGRFYRGNVPATIIYADGSFFPEEAAGDRHKESYKTSIVEGFKKYFENLSKATTEKEIKRYKIIKKLYGFRIDALSNIDYLY